MSRLTARNALDQISGRPALIAPQYVGFTGAVSEVASGGLFADLRELATSNHTQEAALWELRKETLVAAYGFSPGQGGADKPYGFGDGKAIIPVHGMLINRLGASYGYVTGYNYIRNATAAAEADPDVTGIIYDVNSYGGTVAGCIETGEVIAGATKPTLAMVDSSAYSAAYWLSSQANNVAMTKSAGVGSVGVVLMHADVSKALEDFGVKVTFIHAGAHKVDGNPYQPLSDDVKAGLQTEVNGMYNGFVAAVASGRGLPEQAVRDTEARSYWAEDALSLGLVDAISTPAEAVEGFFDQAETILGNKDTTMATNTPLTDAQIAQTNQEAADRAAAAALAEQTAATAARQNERTRISAIQSHAEAAGRAGLASHLALNTDLTVEAASAILAAAAKETAPENSNPFQAAMDSTRNPNVGAGGGTSDQSNMTPAQRILAAQSNLTGYRAKTA